MKKNIHLIAGARPNFMKIAPLYHALIKRDWADVKLVHTGQHYDANMSDSFFQDLKIPAPDFNLNVGSGTHAQQTAQVMIEYEKLCANDKPEWVIVVGDVNSTIACSLVAAKLHIKVAHLEAGLRSRDRQMPEEINRIVTDQLSDLLWTPSIDGNENLKQEGIEANKIELVGNIMIDSFELQRDRIKSATSVQDHYLQDKSFAVLTLHRPSNVDEQSRFAKIIQEINLVSTLVSLVFPIHPRTKQKLKDFRLYDELSNNSNIKLCEPLGYIEFMNLVCSSQIVITDSGGIQEETTYLDIPCVTLRKNTERPITIKQGTNILVEPENLFTTVEKSLLKSSQRNQIQKPKYWDGQTANRVVNSLEKRLFGNNSD
ncbi:MAG: UDP-N-acetylglucosamine 2-epimerase (non-hydrolyzing) [Pseudomonadota bacterium]